MSFSAAVESISHPLVNGEASADGFIFGLTGVERDKSATRESDKQNAANDGAVLQGCG